MKKCIYTLIILFTPLIISAESKCSIEEQGALKTEANLIKVEYTEMEYKSEPGTVQPPETVPEEEWATYVEITYGIDISILNLSENFYVEVASDLNDYTENFYFSDFVDGKYSFNDPYLYEVATYIFTIKTSDNTSCPDEDIKILYLTKPKYNQLAFKDVCRMNDNMEVCKMFTFNENLDETYFAEEMQDVYLDSDNNDDIKDDVIKEDDSDYNIYIILGIAIIFSGIIAVVIKNQNKHPKNKRHKRKKGGKNEK